MDITPEHLREAYVATDLIPSRTDHDPLMGTSEFLFALSKHTGYGYKRTIGMEAVCRADFLAQYGLTPSYLTSFRAGWNGKPEQGDAVAWSHGRDCWNSLEDLR